MKQFTVVWDANSELQLAELWLRAKDRPAFTAAVDEAERLLSADPSNYGEEFFGDWIIVCKPLQIAYTIYLDDRMVKVIDVWSPD